MLHNTCFSRGAWPAFVKPLQKNTSSRLLPIQRAEAVGDFFDVGAGIEGGDPKTTFSVGANPLPDLSSCGIKKRLKNWRFLHHPELTFWIVLLRSGGFTIDTGIHVLFSRIESFFSGIVPPGIGESILSLSSDCKILSPGFPKCDASKIWDKLLNICMQTI